MIAFEPGPPSCKPEVCICVYKDLHVKQLSQLCTHMGSCEDKQREDGPFSLGTPVLVRRGSPSGEKRHSSTEAHLGGRKPRFHQKAPHQPLQWGSMLVSERLLQNRILEC